MESFVINCRFFLLFFFFWALLCFLHWRCLWSLSRNWKWKKKLSVQGRISHTCSFFFLPRFFVHAASWIFTVGQLRSLGDVKRVTFWNTLWIKSRMSTLIENKTLFCRLRALCRKFLSFENIQGNKNNEAAIIFFLSKRPHSYVLCVLTELYGSLDQYPRINKISCDFSI